MKRSLSAILQLCILLGFWALSSNVRADSPESSTSNQLWHNSQTGTGLNVSWTYWSFFTTAANKAKDIRVVRQVDGRLHAFMIGLDDQIWHNEQTGTSLTSAWTGWNYLSAPGDRAKSLLVVKNGDGRLHAFMIGMDAQIWHNDQTGTGVSSAWSGWNYLSQAGDKATSLVVVPNGDGRLHAFRIGLDGQIWHNDQTGTSFGDAWSGWNYLSRPGNKAKSLVVVPNGDGRLHAFMIGLDDQIWHNDQTGTGYGDAWSDWNYLSQAGNKAKSLVVVPNGDGRLHAFMIGLDDQIWHNDQTGTSYGDAWSGWNYLSQAGDRARSLLVAADADGRLHAFMIGLHYQVWHNDQTGTSYGDAWTGWTWLSSQGDKAKSLIIERDGLGRLHAFARRF